VCPGKPERGISASSYIEGSKVREEARHGFVIPLASVASSRLTCTMPWCPYAQKRKHDALPPCVVPYRVSYVVCRMLCVECMWCHMLSGQSWYGTICYIVSLSYAISSVSSASCALPFSPCPSSLCQTLAKFAGWSSKWIGIWCLVIVLTYHVLSRDVNTHISVWVYHVSYMAMHECMLHWCCFYYFVRNSVVALLEALCAQM